MNKLLFVAFIIISLALSGVSAGLQQCGNSDYYCFSSETCCSVGNRVYKCCRYSNAQCCSNGTCCVGAYCCSYSFLSLLTTDMPPAFKESELRDAMVQ